MRVGDREVEWSGGDGVFMYKRAKYLYWNIFCMYCSASLV